MTAPIPKPNPAPQSNNPIVSTTGQMLQAFYQWMSTVDSSFRSVLASVNATQGGGSGGIYNVTSAPYNADSTGATDSTTAFQNALSDALGAGGIVFVPGGRYLINGQLNVGVRMVGSGAFQNNAHTGPGSLLIQGTNAGTFISLNAGFGFCSLEHIAISAWNASNVAGDAVQMGPNGGGMLFDVNIKYGRYCVNIQCADAILFAVHATRPFSAVCYLGNGVSYIYRCNFDHGNFTGQNLNNVPIRANSTAYTTGTTVRLGAPPSTMLTATAGGTSGSSFTLPSPWSYNTNYADGTGTLIWQVEAPYVNTFASIFADQNCFGLVGDGIDMSGSIWSSLYLNTGALASQPNSISLKGCALNSLINPLQGNSGSSLFLEECFIGPVVSGNTAALFQTNFVGNCTILNCDIAIPGATNGIGINAGQSFKIIGNDFHGGGAAVVLGNSIFEVLIEGNQLGGGRGNPDYAPNTTGVTIGNSCSNIGVKGNFIDRATTAAVTIGTSCTFIDVSHNTINGTAAITNNSSGGTGVRIVENTGYNPVGTGSISPGASPWTYTASSSPESIHMNASTTVNSVTINGGGNLIPVALANVAFELGPDDVMVVTYTGTLTATRFIH